MNDAFAERIEQQYALLECYKRLNSIAQLLDRDYRLTLTVCNTTISIEDKVLLRKFADFIHGLLKELDASMGCA